MIHPTAYSLRPTAYSPAPTAYGLQPTLQPTVAGTHPMTYLMTCPMCSDYMTLAAIQIEHATMPPK